MSQDVNADWVNRSFVESIELAMRKCVDFLSDFHEQAKYRLSEVDQRLTSLERKVDFVEAQLANADPQQRNAQPKKFEGSTFDPQVRREQVKKFRERLHKTDKVFSDRVIAPKKEQVKGGKLIVGGPKAQSKSQPKEILGAPKSQGKGNIPIAQAQKQMAQQKEMARQQSQPKSQGKAKAQGKPEQKQAGPPPAVPGSGGPGGGAAPGPGGGGGGAGGPGSRAPPNAAQAQAAMAAQGKQGKQQGGPPPPGPPQVPQIPQVPKQAPKQAPKQQQQPPVPKPPPGPGANGPGANGPGGEGEGTFPTDGGPGANNGFPHGDPNAIDILIVRPGNGNVPGGKSKVEIKYTGFLKDGTKFIEHQEVISLGLKQNIKGLEAGVQRMQEGTVAKLWIPSKLGYGVRGAPPLIPQNADLLFEITLLRLVE